ncbi:MAG TPA: hypothetical protein VGM84_11100 [Steroidobacteraceae bacterium]
MKRAALLVLVCGSFLTAAHADPDSPEAPKVGTEPGGLLLEKDVTAEVTVEGHKEKMYRLRKEVDKAADAFFAAFNRANTVPGYNTHCQDEQPTGTYIAVHKCTPKFVDDANGSASMAFVSGRTYDSEAAAVPLRMALYRKQIHVLIKADPKVRKAAFEFDALMERYKATGREKVKER